MPTKNKKPLVGWHLIAIGINATVGAGIFLIPGKIDQTLGALSPLIYLICSLLLLFIALCFSQLGQLTERSGGPYAYAEMAYPGFYAFLVGWICWITAVVSCGAVSRALGIYLGYFWSIPPLGTSWISVMVILGFGALNILGVKWGGNLTLGLTVLKLLPLVFLIALGLPQISFSHLGNIPTEITLSGLWTALALALFATQGFEVIPVVASETHEPRRNVPFAILFALGFVTIFYILMQLIYSTGPADLAGSERPLVDLAGVLLPEKGATIIALTGVVSIFGFIAGITLGAPWYLVPLAEDRHLPQEFTKRLKRFQTPIYAIALSSSAAAALAFHLKLTELILLSTLAVVVQYASSIIALMILLNRKNEKFQKYIIPGMAFMITLIILSQAPLFEWGIFLALVLLGGLLYGLVKKR